MSTAKYETIVEDILLSADIAINGPRPWDIKIRNSKFFERVVRSGSLGLGDSYVDEWWECERLDNFFARLLPSNPEARARDSIGDSIRLLTSVVLNRSSKARAFQIGEKHYDIGNDLYTHMLDKRMIYTCAYWKDAKCLDDAQEHKLDLICRKLRLKPGDKIVDVGCGWGGLIKYAAEKYGVEAVGITVSKEQALVAKEACQGLPVEIRLQDYRDMEGRFDHAVSVGMFEHVGHKNYKAFMDSVCRCLKDDGLFLLHTIGSVLTKYTPDPWIEKYIFPNSLIPSMKQISAAIEGSFLIEDVHNLGYHYAPTLLAWFDNFDSSWGKIRHNFDERFYRMWKYYLLSCAGAFKSRDMQVWQIVLSKRGWHGGYSSIR